jgi:hypothetical protein
VLAVEPRSMMRARRPVAAWTLRSVVHGSTVMLASRHPHAHFVALIARRRARRRIATLDGCC